MFRRKIRGIFQNIFSWYICIYWHASNHQLEFGRLVKVEITESKEHPLQRRRESNSTRWNTRKLRSLEELHSLKRHVLTVEWKVREVEAFAELHVKEYICMLNYRTSLKVCLFHVEFLIRDSVFFVNLRVTKLDRDTASS